MSVKSRHPEYYEKKPIDLVPVTVNFLDLSCNDIEYQESTFAKLSEALNSSNLMDLNLSFNNLGPKSFKHIAIALN